MPREPYPHEKLVQELREIVRGMRSTTSVSDDMDQFYVEKAGYSPMERIMEDNSQRRRRAEAIAKELASIGPPAAEAVALGLRMRGAWCEYLLPYVSAHGACSAISEAIDLVRRRQNDPLSDFLRKGRAEVAGQDVGGPGTHTPED